MNFIDTKRIIKSASRLGVTELVFRKDSYNELMNLIRANIYDMDFRLALLLEEDQGISFFGVKVTKEQ